MTLNTAVKRPTRHRKADGRHHRRTKDYHKPYWPYIPIVGILVAGVLLSHTPFVSGRHDVLGYATDMSVQELLDDTNAQRTSNGLPALSLNATLDSSAQAKANDMAARDYWSHNTPDGQAPWIFFTNAGYSYQLAGENLAYGFATAADTLSGWMNSPAHRANILNSGYTEVGFGYINIANYQSTGPETLVVAHYAKPTVAAAAPASPAPAAPAASAAPAAAPATATSTPVASAEPVPTPTDVSFNKDTVVPATTSGANSTIEPKQEKVSRLQVITAGKAAWSSLLLTVIVLAGAGIFILRHGLAWHRLLRRGERFLLKHPVFDVSLTALVVVALLLGSRSGVIR